MNLVNEKGDTSPELSKVDQGCIDELRKKIERFCKKNNVAFGTWTFAVRVPHKADDALLTCTGGFGSLNLQIVSYDLTGRHIQMLHDEQKIVNSGEAG